MFEKKGRISFQPIIEINDPEVLSIPEMDNGEPLVSLKEMFDGGRLALPSQVKTRVEGIEDTKTPFVRKNIKDKLQIIIELLGDEYVLVIIEPYRSYDFQKKLFNDRVLQIMSENDSVQKEDAEKIASRFVSDPGIYSPHVTGAAIDVAIMDKQTGDYLDMGNLFEYNDKAKTNCEGLTNVQKKNRQLLIRVMETAGFINYPNEWWHWSNGDRYAAMVKGESEARYSAIKIN